jgi:hypothetical protein
MKLKCTDCKIEFFVRHIITKLNDPTLYGKGFKQIACEECGSFKIERVNEITEGYPHIGAWSSQNPTNQKGKK